MNNNQTIGDINNSSLYGSNINGEQNSVSSYNSNCCRTCKIYIIITLFIGIFFCGISVVCLCNILPRTRSLGIDYIGVITGTLSLLVTILVGWNIFSVVHMERNFEELEKKFNDVQYSFKENKNITERRIDRIDNLSGIRTLAGLAKMYESFAGFCATDANHFQSYIAYSIQAACCYANVQNYEKAEKCIQAVLQIENPSKINVSDYEKTKILDLLKSVPCQEKIKDIEKLYILLNELGNDFK